MGIPKEKDRQICEKCPNFITQGDMKIQTRDTNVYKHIGVAEIKINTKFWQETYTLLVRV